MTKTSTLFTSFFFTTAIATLGLAALSPAKLMASGLHGSAATKKTMRSMAGDFKVLLPLVLNRPAFFHSGNEALIGKHLASLADKSGHITGPTKGLSDVGFVATAKEFHQTMAKADRFYKNGQKRQARFLLESSLEYCVSCHTQRHGESANAFAKAVGISEPDAKLGRLGKPKYYSMTRQFDRAAKAYEELLAGSASPLERMTLAPYTEYLVLRLRVAENIPAAEAFLAKLEKTTPDGLIRKDIADWRKSLADIGSWRDRSSFKAAEKMIKKAMSQKVYPMDSSSLVYYIAASKVLRHLIDHSGPATTTKALARDAKRYHLLGLCENNINKFNLSAVHYFQKAIELAPHSAIAQKAYGEYEDIVVFAFTGSSGTHIPKEQKGRMDKLKKLAF